MSYCHIVAVLAKDMLEEQVSNNWPGLAREVDKLVEMLRIEDPKREKLGLGDGTRSLYSSTATVSCFYDYVSTIYLIFDLMKCASSRKKSFLYCGRSECT